MGNTTDAVDWAATIRLAVVVSAFAALAALALAGHLAETTIVVGVIVVATMASWYQLEQPPAPEPARIRRH